MAGILPLELLTEIGNYLSDEGVALAPYTTVCRRWQAAFEPFIHSRNVIIHSDDLLDGDPQQEISLDRFATLTSGTGTVRRPWIRHLQYNIIVPYELPDWTSRKHKGYRLKNPVRDANDQAFKSAIINLFRVLSTWDRTHRLSLQLGLLGRHPGEEPYTSYMSDAWEYTWDFRNGRTKATKPYRACFPDDDASMLPDVPCIDILSFLNIGDPEKGSDHQIWAKAIFQIVQHCPTITKLHVDRNYLTRPDQLEYIQARRQAVSNGLALIPQTLKVFDFINQLEEPWKDTMPALNVLSSESDNLAMTIRNLSFGLRVLKLRCTALSMDFLCPIDDDGQPTAPSLHWPHLETIELLSLISHLAGKWLLYPTPNDETRIAAISDWEYEICHSEEGCISRPVMDIEQFHRLFISLGHAARHMPRLASIDFQLESEISLTFSFGHSAEGIRVNWSSRVDYRPDERAAAAWGFSEDSLELGRFGEGYSVFLTTWPPDRA
ncbi:hypothetical protein BO94DRAFT_552770 [Aspergillus sclerotioniger CBS 115572]|uniref:F-box domain-containing protein n=1 Tax=Aspergillus sclerotioniger CBS 115572 TaxID=1450535 RepID=A0A317XGF4_9EURO|nr:hypothetical protein BO94DRAFT_552770 [Aspergillus sclerotioniger CBS 115572]PWY95960.1 hypothetical protein BO94DRAFT_552770 [Aspergillus sclerotioniger CBS 115572]